MAPEDPTVVSGAFVFTGGVQVSWRCLNALCEAGYIPALAIGYPSSLAKRTGYRSLLDLGSAFGFPVLQAENVNAPDIIERVRAARPRVHFVIGWSQLVGKELLCLPEFGSVGIHPTRLPEGRGRAPIPWSIIKGLKRSAVSLLYLDTGADTGDIIDQVEFDIADDDDAGTLYTKIEELHVRVLMNNISAILSGTAPRTSQDSACATVWPRRRPEDGLIDWRADASKVYDLIRALTHPFPGAFTMLKGQQFAIWKAARPQVREAAAPGLVTEAGDRGIVVSCGRGEILMTHVQPEGESERSAAEIVREGIVRRGDRFGE